MNSLLTKLTSRKLWVSIAAFLGSIGGSVTGIAMGNDILTTVGMVCTMLSAAIYVAAEAYVDAASASSKVTTITASTNSKDVVAALSNTDLSNTSVVKSE